MSAIGMSAWAVVDDSGDLADVYVFPTKQEADEFRDWLYDTGSSGAYTPDTAPFVVPVTPPPPHWKGNL